MTSVLSTEYCVFFEHIRETMRYASVAEMSDTEPVCSMRDTPSHTSLNGTLAFFNSHHRSVFMTARSRCPTAEYFLTIDYYDQMRWLDFYREKCGINLEHFRAIQTASLLATSEKLTETDLTDIFGRLYGADIWDRYMGAGGDWMTFYRTLRQDDKKLLVKYVKATYCV